MHDYLFLPPVYDPLASSQSTRYHSFLSRAVNGCDPCFKQFLEENKTKANKNIHNIVTAHFIGGLCKSYERSLLSVFLSSLLY